MKPIEFEEKYQCYKYGEHPAFTGKEIKQDIQSILSEKNGFSYADKQGIIHTEKGCSSFTKDSIKRFKNRFINGQFPISDIKLYYLEFVGPHEDVLIAQRKYFRNSANIKRRNIKNEESKF